MSLKVFLLIFQIALGAITTRVEERGYLSRYDLVPTAATIQYRKDMGEIPHDLTPYDGVVAVYDCSRIGDEAVLEANGKEFDVMVFDCAGVADGGAAWMERNNIVAEIGYYMHEKNPDLLGSYATIAYYDVPNGTETHMKEIKNNATGNNGTRVEFGDNLGIRLRDLDDRLLCK